MSTLATVGLPVYKSMPYLKETMDSLLSQTSKDFKILAVVQDCNDGSVEFMEAIRDPRLRIIRQPKPGLAEALNRMLREADTPWLIRQDTDDVAYPNRIERLLHWIERYPNAGMFYSLADYHPKEQCLGQFRCTRGNPAELREIVQSGYLLSICHPSVVLNREKTLDIGGYTVKHRPEDLDLWWRMALKYDVQFIPEVLIGYRQNTSSITSQGLKRTHVESLYHQYLLLSHLHGWEPQPLDRVQGLLGAFISERHVRSREKLRASNMYLGQKRYYAAALKAIRSFLYSPAYFVGRIVDEVNRSSPITNGVNPRYYLRKKAYFWPQASQ